MCSQRLYQITSVGGKTYLCVGQEILYQCYNRNYVIIRIKLPWENGVVRKTWNMLKVVNIYFNISHQILPEGSVPSKELISWMQRSFTSWEYNR